MDMKSVLEVMKYKNEVIMRFDSKGYKDQMIKQSNCDCRIVWNHTTWYEITLWISANWQMYLSN